MRDFLGVCVDPDNPLNRPDFSSMTYAEIRQIVDQEIKDIKRDKNFGRDRFLDPYEKNEDEAREKRIANYEHFLNYSLDNLLVAEFGPLSRASDPDGHYRSNKLKSTVCSSGFLKDQIENGKISENGELRNIVAAKEAALAQLHLAAERFKKGEYRLGEFPQQQESTYDFSLFGTPKMRQAVAEMGEKVKKRLSPIVDYTRNPRGFDELEKLREAIQGQVRHLPPVRKPPNKDSAHLTGILHGKSYLDEGEQALSKTVALVIGITSFDSMTREDAAAYASALGDSLTELRLHKIPIVWGQIGSSDIVDYGNELWIPSNNTLSKLDSRPYDTTAWVNMAFNETHWGRQVYGEEFSHIGKEHNNDIHLVFLQQFGPRRNEVVYRKPTMDTLLHPDDIKTFGAGYRDELLKQAGVELQLGWDPDPERNHANRERETNRVFNGLFRDPTLADHFRQQGYRNVLILGAMADFCCTETAISSATKGFNTTIATDRVLGWSSPVTTRKQRFRETMVWERPNGFADHVQIIEAKINSITHNDPVRRFSEEQTRQIGTIKLQPFDDCMSDLVMGREERPTSRTPSARREKKL